MGSSQERQSVCFRFTISPFFTWDFLLFYPPNTTMHCKKLKCGIVYCFIPRKLLNPNRYHRWLSSKRLCKIFISFFYCFSLDLERLLDMEATGYGVHLVIKKVTVRLDYSFLDFSRKFWPSLCPRPLSHGTEFSNFFPCDALSFLKNKSLVQAKFDPIYLFIFTPTMFVFEGCGFNIHYNIFHRSS